LIYLGIDPGERTGVAYLDVAEDAAPVLIHYEEVYGGLEGFKMWWETKPIDYDKLIAEQYIVRQGTSQKNSYAPMHIVGFLSQFDPILQVPAGRRVSVSDAVLKRLGVHLPGERLRNAREAVRHVIWRLKQERHMPTLRVGWGRDE
jgi:hypothetical protein